MDTILPQAGRDLTVQGSAVAGDGDVVPTAANKASILAGTTTSTEKSFSKVQENGFLSGGSFGISYGQRTTTEQDQDGTSQSGQARSLVGSNQGSLIVTAGDALHISGSDLAAAQDINLTGQSVTIDPGRDAAQSRYATKMEQDALTLAVGGSVVNAIQTINSMGEAAGKTGNSRVKALAAATAAMAAANIAQDVAQNGVNVSISLTAGHSESAQSQATASSNAIGSTVTAGRDLRISATGAGENSNITVIGSDLAAGHDLTLAADHRIDLLAAQDTEAQHSQSSSSSAGISVAASIGSRGIAYGITASASQGRGNEDGEGTTQRNTHLTAGNVLALQSGGDTTLQGAVAGGRQVIADVGGNLNLESLQDTVQFDSKSQNASASLTVGFGSASGGISTSKGNTRSDYTSVQEQSGIQAGDGGFQINVQGNTDLKGAVIASSQQAIQDGKNSLTTGSLTTSDIRNHAAASADSSGIDLSSDMLKQGKYGATKAVVGTLLNNAGESGSSSGQTRSAVSAGEVTITDEARQRQLTGKNAEATVAGLNRDTANAQVAAQRQDVQAMRETVEAERAIKAEAFKQITVIGDKVYRKETEEKKLVNITCQENRTACSQAVVTLDQIDAVNGKITTFNNGMLNDEQAALMNAYMQATGQKLQDGVIVVVNPMINDVVSEAAWVAWKKVEEVFGFGTSSVGDLNLALAAIALAQGAKLDTVSHSAGNFGVAEMLRRLDETGVKDAAIGTVTMFGSPVNAQGTANTVNTITSGQGTVQQSTHRDDAVGTFIGGNTPTGGLPSSFGDAHSTYGPNVQRDDKYRVWGTEQGSVSVPTLQNPTTGTGVQP